MDTPEEVHSMMQWKTGMAGFLLVPGVFLLVPSIFLPASHFKALPGENWSIMGAGFVLSVLGAQFLYWGVILKAQLDAMKKDFAESGRKWKLGDAKPFFLYPAIGGFAMLVLFWGFFIRPSFVNQSAAGELEDFLKRIRPILAESDTQLSQWRELLVADDNEKAKVIYPKIHENYSNLYDRMKSVSADGYELGLMQKSLQEFLQYRLRALELLDPTQMRWTDATEFKGNIEKSDQALERFRNLKSEYHRAYGIPERR